MLIIFVEEPSMEAALSVMLRRMNAPKNQWQIISFQGVTNMKRSLPNRLRFWNDPVARFLIIRDNDNGDCKLRKRELVDICEQANKADVVKVRIVSQELESWFIAQPNAIRQAGYRSRKKVPKAWRNVESVRKPSRELANIFPTYTKIDGATRVTEHIDLETTTPSSLRAVLGAISQFINAEGR